MCRRLVGSQSRSGWMRKILPPPQFDLQTVQPIVSRGKLTTITYSECVFLALHIQHAKCLRHVILISVACLALPYFYTLSHKRQDFWENVIDHKMCFEFLWKILRNISHSKVKITEILSRMYVRLHVQNSLYLSNFKKTWILSTDFSKKILKCQISWKFIQWEPSFCIRTDRQTDMTKVICLFEILRMGYKRTV